MHFQHIQKSLFDTEIVQPEDDKNHGKRNFSREL